MVGHAFRVENLSHNLLEADGQYLTTIHQLICGGVFRWHPNLQLDLGRAPPTHSRGPPNIVTTQVVCQFGDIHFWHDSGSIYGIY